MYLSTYSKIYPSDESKDSFILFSTKRASIAEVPASMLRRIEAGRQIPEADERLLRGLGLLVSDPEREQRRMLKYVEELNVLNKTLSIKIVMSLDCNLACRYCFEGNRKGKFYMTMETADALVGSIRKRIDHPLPSRERGREREETDLHNPSLVRRGQKNSPTLAKGGEGGFSRDVSAVDEVHLVFYGGEPLLSKDLIIHIARKVRALAKRRGLRFGFSLQTNGTLLTKKIADELRPLGLKTAFITVDGPMKCHDRSRPFKSGRGSFDRIIRNVRDVSGTVEVQLNGNFTRKNYPRFPALADFLLENGLGPKEIPSLRFFPVAAESSDILPDFGEGCSSVNEPWLFEATVMLREEVLKRGYRCDRIAPGVCMMEHRNNILVNFNGEIYKCPGLIGREGYRAGSIREGIGDYRTSHHMDAWKNEECLACAYLPLCFGGCRYTRLVRQGDMSGVECNRPFFDATLEAFVKQDMRYGLAG